MTVITRGSDVAAMMLLYKEMAMEMAEDLNEIAQIVGDGEFINAEWIFEQYEQQASGPTVFENVLIREGRTTAEECAENSRKNIFIKAMLRTIKDRRYVVHASGWKRTGYKFVPTAERNMSGPTTVLHGVTAAGQKWT